MKLKTKKILLRSVTAGSIGLGATGGAVLAKKIGLQEGAGAVLGYFVAANLASPLVEKLMEEIRNEEKQEK